MNEPALFQTYAQKYEQLKLFIDKNSNESKKFNPANIAHLHCPSSGPDAELDYPPYKTWVK
jgi:hypothetical protein